MRNRSLMMTAAICLLAAVPASAADPATMEVAGIRLGASPSQVKDALRRVGYRVTETREAEAFDQRLAREVATRKGTRAMHTPYAGVGTIIATGPHQEKAEVGFAQTAGGSIVSRIKVEIAGTTMTATAFREQLIARYGKPDAVRGQGLTLSWCSAPAVKICGATYTGGELDTALPKLLAELAYGTNIVTLDEGAEAERRRSQAFEAAIVRQAPRTDKAAF